MKDNKTFADLSKDIQKKYKDRYDTISVKGLMTEMERLREMQEGIKSSMQDTAVQEATEQFFNGGLFNKKGIIVNNNPPLFNFLGSAEGGRNSSMIIPDVPNRVAPSFNVNANIEAWGNDSKKMNERTYSASSLNNTNDISAQEESYGRDPLMYASALGPIAALLMNKKTDPIDRSAAGRFVSTGTAGVGTASPRQTEFKEMSMSPLERALMEQSRGFTGMNAQVSGGNAGMFLANELANQSNLMGARSNAALAQQQANMQVAGMNAQEQARIDQMKMQDQQMRQRAEQVNAQLALQYDEIDAMNEGAFRTNQANAVQSIFQNLGTIGKENTQGNIILKALGYDEMGNYGGKGRSSTQLLDMITNLFTKK